MLDFFRGLNWVSRLGAESSGRLAPQLTRLQDMERLYDLAQEKTPEARGRLGAACADIFADSELNAREQEILSDIMVMMLRQAERDLRMAIADRLAGVPQTPLRVILFLANDEIDVARPVLARSKVLEDVDLIYLIQTQQSAYWQVMAAREKLRAPVVRELVATHDPATANVLVRNNDADIPQDCYKILSEMAAVVTDLRGPLLQRADLPRDLVARIYTYTAEKIEQAIKDRAEVPNVVLDHVADAADELIATAAGDAVEASDLMIQTARTLHERGQLTPDAMMRALKLGQEATFSAQLSVYADIPLDRVQNVLADQSGASLAAIFRARNVDRKVFLRLFLLTNKMRGSAAMVDPQSLNDALRRFDLLTPEKCQMLINRYRVVH